MSTTRFKTINGWTKARMIEQIYKRNNGTKSMNNTGTAFACAYRGVDYNACAVGCFIPVAAYKPGFEGVEISILYHHIHEHMPLDLEGMCRLQYRHDVYHGPDDMRQVLAAWIEENVSDLE